MGSSERFGPTPGGLSLEPLEGEAAAPAPATGKAKFHPNTRDGADRRTHDERREQLRLQDDRRSGKERRPKKSWDKGKNL